MKQKKGIVKFIYALMLGAGLLFSGCSREQIKTQKIANLDLSKYHTYAWLPVGDTTMTSFATDPAVSERIRNKVNREMQKKGYTLNSENPDLLVLVRTKYDDAVEIQTYPSGYAYYGPGFYTGPWYDYYYPYYNNIGFIGGDVRAVEYTKGTVVIDLIDTKKNKIVWRGKATEPVYDQSDVKDEIVENIDEIFEAFPS